MAASTMDLFWDFSGFAEIYFPWRGKRKLWCWKNLINCSLQKCLACQPTTVQWQDSENFAFIALITSNDHVSKEPARPPVQDLLLICTQLFVSTFPPPLIVFVSRVSLYLSQQHACICLMSRAVFLLVFYNLPSGLLCTFPAFKQLLIWFANYIIIVNIVPEETPIKQKLFKFVGQSNLSNLNNSFRGYLIECQIQTEDD